jgi:hypothetical protein
MVAIQGVRSFLVVFTEFRDLPRFFSAGLWGARSFVASRRIDRCCRKSHGSDSKETQK